MINITFYQGNGNKNQIEYITSHLSEWLLLKTQQIIIGFGEDVKKKEYSCTVGKNLNWCSHFAKQYGEFSKNQKNNYHMIQQFHCWVFIQRKLKQYIYFVCYICIYWASQVVLLVKNPLANAGDVRKRCRFHT